MYRYVTFGHKIHISFYIDIFLYDLCRCTNLLLLTPQMEREKIIVINALCT